MVPKDDEFYPAQTGCPGGIRALHREQAAPATQKAANAHNGKGRDKESNFLHFTTMVANYFVSNHTMVGTCNGSTNENA